MAKKNHKFLTERDELLGPIFASIAGNLAFPVRMHIKLVLKKKKKKVIFYSLMMRGTNKVT